MKGMKYFYIVIIVAFCVFELSACNKYLDVQPKGFQLLTTTMDFDQWLNNTTLETSEPYLLSQLQDNIDEPAITTPPSEFNDLVYVWAPQFTTDPTAISSIWVDHYKNISLFNTVIQHVGSASGPDQDKSRLFAEALLGRAQEYLYLVNEYGKEYDKSTATTDLAVPFVTSDDLATKIPGRGTVQEIYDHIVTDLKQALSNLPLDNSKNRYRGSKAAAYAVLARTSLYMRNYALAQNYAQLALENGPHSLVDYNTISQANHMPDVSVAPDAIYSRLSSSLGFSVYPTLNFLRNFDRNDLRLHLYYSNLGDTTFKARGIALYQSAGSQAYATSRNWGPTVAEMKLIIAEGAARNGDISTALQQLNAVRKCRISQIAYQDYQSAIADSVLQHVLTERTYELPYCGLRWFDMRRLDLEGRLPTFYRYDGNGKPIATLAPNSPRYTLQIPIGVMYFNPGWQQNP